MCNKLLLSIQLIFLLSFSVLGQVDLIFPKNDYVFDSVNIEFDWNDYKNATSYDLQVSTDQSFLSLIVDETLIPVNNFSATNLTENETYYWRSRANNSSWSSTYSFRIVDFSAFSQLELWLKADSVQTVSGSRVSVWYDLSANLNHYNQPTTANQPYFQSNNNGINDFPMIEFVPSEPSFFDANDFSSLSEGEVFSLIELKNAPATTGNTSGLWSFGTSSSQDHYPYNNNVVYCGFGRNSRFTIGDVSGNVDLTEPHLLNVNSGASFNFRINDIELFASTSGAPSFNSNVHIGRSLGGHYMDGSIGELILFNEVLPDSLRSLTHQYLRHKYAPPVNLGPNITQYGYCDTILHAGKRFKSYLWSDGSTADSLVVTEPGTYWVEVTDIFGFTSTDTIEVTFPEPDTPNNQLFCPGNQKTWYTNLGPNYNYLWSDGSTADSLSINTPGDYHVQITDTNGCVFQSDTLYFDADPFETIVDLGADTSLCSGNSIELVAGDTEAIDYLWNTGDTDSTIILNTTGTYYLDVINDNGCEATDTIDVTIIGDAPTVIPGINTTVCQNEEITYQDQSTTSDGSDIISWDWGFGDGGLATDEQGNYIYANNGVFNISLTIETSAGCFNDTTISITVNEQPMLDFTTINECQEAVINFNGSQLTPTTINTWEWNFDDPSSGIDNEGSGQNTTHIFESSDDYDVELIGTDVNGCSDTVVKTVTIEPAPEADFEFEEVCVGEIVIFDNLSSVDTPNVISNYNWSFGDGTFSGQAEPQKLFSAPGNYTVNLNATADNGCSNEISLPLKVHALPNVDYSTNASCAGIETVFDDESFVTNGSVAEVYWTFNSSPQVNGFSVEEVFETSGDQTVEQTVVSSFGCSNSDSYTINVNDYISAGFEINPNAFLADYPTAFENLSEGASSNTWTFDNLGSSNEENPSFTFPSSTIGQTLTVELLIENDFECRDSVALILPVLEPRTDLAANQLFTQSSDGFYIIGVELENKGTSPINSADLFLRTASLSVVKETWEGELKAGEKEIYIFSASPSTTVSANNEDKNFICVEAEIRTPAQFIDENLSNNTVCSAISEENAILIAPYPNPVDHELNVQIVMPFEETGTVKIYDAQGKLVNTVIQDENLKVGLSTFYVNTVNWQSGAYSIVYEGESANEVVKIVKL
ncbi:MAG: PKD domain-containing protein [Brumimicrobium sp.]